MTKSKADKAKETIVPAQAEDLDQTQSSNEQPGNAQVEVSEFLERLSRRTAADPWAVGNNGRYIYSITKSNPELNRSPAHIAYLDDPTGASGPEWQRGLHAITAEFLASHKADNEPAKLIDWGSGSGHEHTGGETFWYANLQLGLVLALPRSQGLTLDEFGGLFKITRDEVWEDVRHGYLPTTWRQLTPSGESVFVIDTAAFSSMVDLWMHP